MVRMIDVARDAGVSVATVSRVLNGIPVRSDLEVSVRAAIARTGYTLDRTARSLRRQVAEVIALVVADIENPFFTALARGVEDVAQGAGLSVVLCNSGGDAYKEATYLRVAFEERMAGVIVVPAAPDTDVSRLLDKGMSVVAADRPLRDDVDSVTFDNRLLGRRATEALIDAGFVRIACVTGPSRISTAADRASGWRDALEAAGLEPDPDLLVHTDFRVEGGIESALQLSQIQNPPDAVVAANNLVGVGVLRVLSVAGSSHEGVSVIGDLPFATTMADNVWLTSLNTAEMGRAAARMLVERIRGGEKGPGRHLVQQVAEPVLPFHRDQLARLRGSGRAAGDGECRGAAAQQAARREIPLSGH